MNKGELVDHIAEELEVSKALADQMVNSFVNAVYQNIRKDGVRLAGFGTFSSAKRKARVGRNPQTGEEIKIPARWVPTFKAGTLLKESAERKKK
tara:strand:+ start:173 stop:454 length:282 start_codon:yes stop_codon:yes gene_type:complete